MGLEVSDNDSLAMGQDLDPKVIFILICADFPERFSSLWPKSTNCQPCESTVDSRPGKLESTLRNRSDCRDEIELDIIGSSILRWRLLSDSILNCSFENFPVSLPRHMGCRFCVRDSIAVFHL